MQIRKLANVIFTMLWKTAIVIIIISHSVCLCRLYFGPKPSSPIVKTDLGEVQGVTSISRDGREYYEYLGIPYAKPPVGYLRFEDPQEPEPWTGVRYAGKYRNECLQYQKILGMTVGREDCLFLNIFSPKRNGSLVPDMLPVMVFIHGGSYLEGSANLYRPDYFMDTDVVLVTLNYRLSAFGFLNTGDGIIRGNAGLKDQVKALEFVQRNIGQFGGDPKRVTIFGESAGGASAQLHMISKRSEGLFQKAISQSGSTLSPWSFFSKNPKQQAERLGSLLQCTRNSTSAMIQCLKEFPAPEIVRTFFEVKDPIRDKISAYLPSVEPVEDENSFLTEHPVSAMKKMNRSIPWLTGVNSDEGLIVLGMSERNASFRSYITDPKNWLKSMPSLMFIDKVDPQDMDQVRKYYFGPETPINSEKHFQNYTNLFSDVFVNYGFLESVRSHSQHSPVYAYHFSYSGEFSFYNFLQTVRADYPMLDAAYYVVKTWIRKNIFKKQLPEHGVSHFDEIPFLFKLDMLNDITPWDRDYEMSKNLVRLWTSFAHDEKSMKLKNLAWNRIDPKKAEIEVFKIDQIPEYIKAPYAERVHFLKSNIFKS